MPTALLLHPQPMPRRTIAQALRRAGVRRVLEARDAAEAQRVLSAELVSLVCTPWETPGLAGRPLLQALRNRGRNRNLPVIVLDTGMTPAQSVAAVKAGAAGRVTLPAQPEALRKLLGQLAEEGLLVAAPDATVEERVAPSRSRRPRSEP